MLHNNSQGKLKYTTVEEAREANRKRNLENYYKKKQEKLLEKENYQQLSDSGPQHTTELKIQRYVLNPTTPCVEIMIGESILRLTFP